MIELRLQCLGRGGYEPDVTEQGDDDAAFLLMMAGGTTAPLWQPDREG